MKYIKAITFLVVALVLLFLLAALFMPSEFKLERSIEINSPSALVFDNVADLNKFNKWNDWYSIEPSAYLPVKGAPGAGQVSEWKGDTVGTGNLRNIIVEPNKYIEQIITFTTPYESSSKIYFKFDEQNGVTRVVWSIEGSLSYPIGRLMKVPMEAKLNKSFNQGLVNLKKICEKGKN